MCGERLDAVTVYKGEDSAAFGVRQIRIFYKTSIPHDDATAEFIFFSFKKTFTKEEVAENNMVLQFTKDDTKEFPLGTSFATFRLTDSSGNLLTATTRIPVLVRTPDKQVYPSTENVVVEAECLSVTIRSEIDYSYVTNRPKINHVELVGDKSWDELGLPALSRVYIDPDDDECLVFENASEET